MFFKNTFPLIPCLSRLRSDAMTYNKKEQFLDELSTTTTFRANFLFMTTYWEESCNLPTYFYAAFIAYLISLNIATIFVVQRGLVPLVIAGAAFLFLVPSVSVTAVILYLFLNPVTDWLSGVGILSNIGLFGLLNGVFYIVLGIILWIVRLVAR